MGCIIGPDVAPSGEPPTGLTSQSRAVQANHIFRSPSIRVSDQQNEQETNLEDIEDNDEVQNIQQENSGNENQAFEQTEEAGNEAGQAAKDEPGHQRTNVPTIGNHVTPATTQAGQSGGTTSTDQLDGEEIPRLQLSNSITPNRTTGRPRRRRRTPRQTKQSNCLPTCSNPIRPDKPCKVTGCIFLPNGYLVIVDNNNKRIKLYDTNLKCCSFLDLEFRPFDVCELKGSIYVTAPRIKLVQKFSITFPMLFVSRKLIQRSSFPTEGECRAIVAYHEDLIVSMKFSTHMNVEITDSSWQVQIMTPRGQVKRRIAHNPEGAPLFFDAKYITLTPNMKELVVAEGEDNRVKCIDISSGTLTFNHHMEDPKGVVCDKSSNIYILGRHGAIRWILADREYVKVLIKGTKSINYSECIAYSKDKHTLAVPRNENKIELFRIRNSIHQEPID